VTPNLRIGKPALDIRPWRSPEKSLNVFLRVSGGGHSNDPQFPGLRDANHISETLIYMPMSALEAIASGHNVHRSRPKAGHQTSRVCRDTHPLTHSVEHLGSWSLLMLAVRTVVGSRDMHPHLMEQQLDRVGSPTKNDETSTTYRRPLNTLNAFIKWLLFRPLKIETWRVESFEKVGQVLCMGCRKSPSLRLSFI
jgi:hypothetical protein